MAQDSINRFSDRVENYTKYRPDYPSEVLEFLKREINLTQSWKVADIGAGTGISSKLFLDNGNKVFAIEPNREMLRAAAVYLDSFSNVELIDATAENTTLRDNSVDMVSASQAFHWFDFAKCVKEFRRILVKGGFVTLIWNERVLDENEFLREYEMILEEFGTDYESVRHDKLTKESLESAFESDFTTATFTNSQTLDLDGFKGRAFSASYTPGTQDKQHEKMRKRLESLFAEFEEKGKIHLLYNTNIFFTQI